jgi:hypothetical protein
MSLARFLTFLIASVLSTGCFEIVEEIDQELDGSGNFSYLVNMSQSREKLKTLLSIDSVNGLRVPKKANIEEQLEKGLQLVKSADGISNVSITKDYENFIFNISFHYDSLASLNKAAAHIHANMSPYGKMYSPIFDVHYGGFSRVADAHTIAFLQNLHRKNPVMLRDASYTTVYRFKKGVKTLDSDAKISKSKMAVMYKYNTSKLAINPNIIQQNIILN